MKTRSSTFLSPALYCLMSLFASTLVHANNLPPVAVIELWPDKSVYYHGETIDLYGEASYVQSSGYINYYQWYINGELKLQGSGATNYNHTVVMKPGMAQQQLTIKLEVRHSNGQWDSKTITRTEKQKPGQHYYLTDHLGSVRATVNATGTLIGWDDFYPFGMVMPGRSSNSANPNDLYKFTGHERDREAGLEIDFMNARTYDSEIGRFLQRDPHAANYPGISPYVYVANNPLIFIDPTGRDYVLHFDEKKKTVTVAANYYTTDAGEKSVKANIAFWNDQSGKEKYTVDGIEYTIHYDLDYKVVEQGEIAGLVSNDPGGNSWEVVPDGSLKGNVIGGTSSGNRIQITESYAEDVIVGGHEIGHTLGMRHDRNNTGIMARSYEDASLSVARFNINDMIFYALRERQNFELNRNGVRIPLGKGTIPYGMDPRKR